MNVNGPIKGVSVWHKGIQYNLPAPNRHHNVIHHIHNVTGDRGIGAEQTPDGRDGQGFYLECGKYIDRYESAILAVDSGQIEKTNWGEELFSEDLW